MNSIPFLRFLSLFLINAQCWRFAQCKRIEVEDSLGEDLAQQLAPNAPEASDVVAEAGSMKTSRRFFKRNMDNMVTSGKGVITSVSKAVIGMQPDIGVMELGWKNTEFELTQCKVEAIEAKFQDECQIDFEGDGDSNDAYVFETLQHTQAKLWEDERCTERGEDVRRMYKFLFDDQHADPCSVCERCNAGDETCPEAEKSKCDQQKAVALLLPRQWRLDRRAPCTELLEFLSFYPIFVDLHAMYHSSFGQWMETKKGELPLEKVANWMMKYSGKLDEQAHMGGITLGQLEAIPENNKLHKEENARKLEQIEQKEKEKAELIESGKDENDAGVAQLDTEIKELSRDPLQDAIFHDLEQVSSEPTQDVMATCKERAKGKWEAVTKRLEELLQQPCKDQGKEIGERPKCGVFAETRRFFTMNKTTRCSDNAENPCPPGTKCSCMAYVDIPKITSVNLAIFIGGNVLTQVGFAIGGLVAGLVSGGIGAVPAALGASTASATVFPDILIEVPLMMLYTAYSAAKSVQCACGSLACKTLKLSHGDGKRDDRGSSFSVHCYLGQKGVNDDYQEGVLPFPGIKCGFVPEGQVTGMFRQFRRFVMRKKKTAVGGSCGFTTAACEQAGFVDRDTETHQTLPYGTDAQNCVRVPIDPEELSAAAGQAGRERKSLDDLKAAAMQHLRE